ncbi:hypothetical protein [Nereida sp. MMG025]|uniref:hypothetical protein n=1 Tax=Nereida sp. MMG025 TaxID=2909981 RepID=UPI001F45BDD6|nr:hypothetical protein [Nereida sp. MMG025]MCF6445017.1 hypothetical protein [Nereida sp. MMG025]
MSDVDPNKGALKANGATLPEIWVKLHRLARGWSDLWQSDDLEYERSNLDRTSLSLLQDMKDIEAESWINLCAAAGWTAYGAIAVSWCKNGTLEQVWASWGASGFPIKRTEGFERPAHLINSSLLPKTNSLSKIMVMCQHRTLPLCITQSARKGAPLTFDIPVQTLSKMPAQAAAFLLPLLETQNGLDADERHLADFWSASGDARAFIG